MYCCCSSRLQTVWVRSGGVSVLPFLLTTNCMVMGWKGECTVDYKLYGYGVEGECTADYKLYGYGVEGECTADYKLYGCGVER